MIIVPQQITDLDSVFGKIEGLLPDKEVIPNEFWNGNTKWNKIICQWFYDGLPQKTKFIPKEGIDYRTALRHIGSILRSFEPKHEHKEAGCAYLLSLWFDDIVVPDKEK